MSGCGGDRDASSGREENLGRPCSRSIAGHDQVSEILRVDLSIRADRDGVIGGAEREIQEETLCQDAPLRDRVEVPIFAVRIDDSVRVDRDVVDAELESVGVVRDAGDRIVRVADTALRVWCSAIAIRE